MIVKLEQDLSAKDIEVLIKYAKMNKDVERLVALLQAMDTRIKCRLEDSDKLVNASEVYYFESMDKRTFVYCKQSVYRSEMRLYQIIEDLGHLGFANKQQIGCLILPMPGACTILINPFIAEIHGVNIGDTLIANINGTEHSFFVSDIAANAKSATIYVNTDELAVILGVPIGAYNGILSVEVIPGGESITRAERTEELNRNAVSNNISAVINQTIGGIVGAILIFLALYVNFWDNTRDMLILHMMGYQVKNIRKLLIYVYMPIVWAAFLITLLPSILLARFIQNPLSMAMSEYIPFGTNIIVIFVIFLLLNILYWLVQLLFGIGAKRMIAKEEMSEFVYAE